MDAIILLRNNNLAELQRIVDKVIADGEVEVRLENVGVGDGTETEFTVNFTDVVTGSETVYVDGVEQTEGAEEDYTIDDATGVITFGEAPAEGAVVQASYDYERTIASVDDIQFYPNLGSNPSFAVIIVYSTT